jgi:hypothetical protein
VHLVPTDRQAKEKTEDKAAAFIKSSSWQRTFYQKHAATGRKTQQQT